MGPFESLGQRRLRWLFLFASGLAVAGFGLVLMLIGLYTGLAAPVFLGLAVAAPATIGCALIIAAPQIPRTGDHWRETIRRARR